LEPFGFWEGRLHRAIRVSRAMVCKAFGNLKFEPPVAALNHRLIAWNPSGSGKAVFIARMMVSRATVCKAFGNFKFKQSLA